MKKIILFFVSILLVNYCFASDGIIKNKRGLVFQALDEGALGYICPRWSLDSSDCKSGQFVYFDFNYDFVDNQIFSIPDNYYFYANGIYRYTNKDNVYKTVRKISIIQQ